MTHTSLTPEGLVRTRHRQAFMSAPRRALVVVVVAGLAGASQLVLPDAGASLRCTMSPAPQQLLVRIEVDTMIATFAPPPHLIFIPPDPERDAHLALPGTLMPSARVTILRADTITSRLIREARVTAEGPIAYIQAQPYRGDCNAIRWTGDSAWVVRGETGYVRARLAPRQKWIGDAPVFIVGESWKYPYPRQRFEIRLATVPGVLGDTGASLPIASPTALFDYEASVPSPESADEAIAWARANFSEALRQPIRTKVTSTILRSDFTKVRAQPNRMRGTYRVSIQDAQTAVAWEFRTFATPLVYPLEDSARDLVDLLASPHVSGYVLYGYVADAGAFPAEAISGPTADRIIYLGVKDRPTAPIPAAAAVPADLNFALWAAPREAWQMLKPFVPQLDSADVEYLSRTGRAPTVEPAGDDRPRLYVTLHVGAGGAIRGDTTLTRAGRSLRVSVERIDTASIGPRWR